MLSSVTINCQVTKIVINPGSKCFEVSSTGYINTRNKSTLATLHSFIRKDMKKSSFFSNLNSLAWYGSYQLWLTREDKEFADPPFLIPHIK